MVDDKREQKYCKYKKDNKGSTLEVSEAWDAARSLDPAGSCLVRPSCEPPFNLPLDAATTTERLHRQVTAP